MDQSPRQNKPQHETKSSEGESEADPKGEREQVDQSPRQNKVHHGTPKSTETKLNKQTEVGVSKARYSNINPKDQKYTGVVLKY